MDNLDNVKIELQKENTANTEFQKHILDAGSFEEALYLAFCGYRYTMHEVKIKTIDGEKVEIVKTLEVDRNAKIINEAGANYLAKAINPLISHLATTSNLSEKQILREWKGKLTSIIFALEDSYYFEGNPYELKIERLPDIITTLATAISITSKSKDGFTLKQLTETILTQIRGSYPITPQREEEKKGGLLGFLKG